MKKNNLEFFLEIYTEEIPARLINDLCRQLENNFTKLLNERDINFDKVESMSTPMRLVIFVNGLSDKSKDKKLEIWGPPENIAISEKKELLRPAKSYMEKNNINEKQILIREKNGMKYLYCEKVVKGTSNKENLKDITINSLKNIKNKKFMKWGGVNFEFIRPIRNIYANFNKKFLKINFSNIPSINIIKGHRFSEKAKKNILNFNEYKKFLKSSDVILNFKDRREKIINEIKKIEEKNHFHVNPDKDLIDHVANLTEYPKVLIGNFDKNFLSIPKEVINSIMKNHQKYFSVFSSPKMNKLMPSFIFVAGSPYLNKRKVIEGNEKVLAARLNDGKFFFDEDMKVGLKNIGKKINSITFIEGIGNYGDKSERIKDLANFINIKLDLGINKNDIDEASLLCKADLASQMVFEFPELQGVMGEYYYLKNNKSVAKSINEHYLPKTRDDDLPFSNLSKLISISDKFDTISSAFHMNLLPTGSSDPYGLRRCCIGIIRIVEKLGINLDLIEILNESFSNIEKRVNKNNKESLNRVKLFFAERIKNYYAEDGFSINILNSVLHNLNSLDLIKIKKKISIIKKLDGSNELLKVTEVFKRLKNITKNNSNNKVNEKLFVNDFEREIHSEINQINEQFINNPSKKESEEFLKKIILSSSVLANFFDNVMVMDKDEDIKNNRLNLLTDFKNLISEFANFSEL